MAIDCPFCDRARIAAPVEEMRGTLVFEPLNPVTPGHLLIAPMSHVEDFAQSPIISANVMRVAAEIAARSGGSFNLITSKGDEATQSIKHLHMHLIPRRADDGLCLPWSTPAHPNIAKEDSHGE